MPIESNQSVPTRGAGSGVISTERKDLEWEVGGYRWQERSWGVDVGRIRADLSGATGHMGEGRSSSHLLAAVLGCRRGWRREARESCPVVWCLESGLPPHWGYCCAVPGATVAGLEWGSVGLSRKHPSVGWMAHEQKLHELAA